MIEILLKRATLAHLSDDTVDGLGHLEALSSDRVTSKSAGSSLNVGRLSAPTPLRR
jgi:hypothetical protein